MRESKIVPVVPTEVMVEAGRKALEQQDPDRVSHARVLWLWNDMLAVCPPPVTQHHKWLALGAHEVIADEDGKILGHIFVGVPTQPKAPISAFADGKQIGLFLTAASARRAVDGALAARRDEI